MTVAPHLELVAEHDFARVARAIDDGNFAELTALIVNIVDQRSQGRDAQTAATSKMSWPFIFRMGNGRPKGPNFNHVTALHFVQLSVNLPARRTHSSMKPCLEGDEEMEMGASPTPKMDSSTN